MFDNVLDVRSRDLILKWLYYPTDVIVYLFRCNMINEQNLREIFNTYFIEMKKNKYQYNSLIYSDHPFTPFYEYSVFQLNKKFLMKIDSDIKYYKIDFGDKSITKPIINIFECIYYIASIGVL